MRHRAQGRAREGSDPLSPGGGQNAGQLRQRLSVSLDGAEQER